MLPPGRNLMRIPSGDRLPVALAAGICLCVAVVGWALYHAVSEWRRESIAFDTLRAANTADLLYETVLRDMSGFQTTVLNSPAWYRYRPQQPHEMHGFVASAFARYPYPEAFFTWHPGRGPDSVVFFYRTERRPGWLTGKTQDASFPVGIQQDRSAARTLLPAVLDAAAHLRDIGTVATTLGGVPHQVVFQIFYDDEYRQTPFVVVGFTVDLDWVRREYFTRLVDELWRIHQGNTGEFGLAIEDPTGALIAGATVRKTDPLVQRRAFGLLFLDPDSSRFAGPALPPDVWQVVVGRAPSLLPFQNAWEADIVLAAASTSALMLAIGLFLVVKAGRASTRVATMRSDFVSAATHELKTPIATIRAAAETLSRDRLSHLTVPQCSRIILTEARRLGRLIENMLAYSKIVDAADTYTFTAVEVAAIFKDIQEDFEAQLDGLGFDLDWDIGPGVTTVRGDRTALRLLFGNVVDNAVKYSGSGRSVYLAAEQAGAMVSIAVIDRGIGIFPEDLHRVVKKFARGQNAPGSGTGLGLAIASRVADDHGGSLSVTSTVGVGTTVTVLLRTP
jgi:signal transduction histidine kinase